MEWVRLWLFVQPVKRIRRALRRRRMDSWTEEHGGPPDEILESFHETETEVQMSEVQQSVLRSILKVAAGALAAKGVIDVGEAASLQIVLETLAAGIIGAIGFVLSHRKHVQ